MRAAGYIRVSTEDQAKEGFSLPNQRKRIEAYCQSQGWELVRVYEDDGYSGRDLRRPGYERMMDDAGWDVIVVLKMDRIHRNSRNFMAMMDGLRSRGKDFVSATESLDTSTAVGRFVMDQIQRIAQLESEQLGERTSEGMREAAAQGYHVGGIPRWFAIVERDGRRYVEPTDEALRLEAAAKVSKYGAAKSAGTSREQIRHLVRYLEAWRRAVADGKPWVRPPLRD